MTLAKAHFRSRRGLFDVTDALVTEYLRPTPQEMWLQNNTTVQDGECYPLSNACAFSHPRQPAKLSGESWDPAVRQDLLLNNQKEDNSSQNNVVRFSVHTNKKTMKFKEIKQ